MVIGRGFPKKIKTSVLIILRGKMSRSCACQLKDKLQEILIISYGF